MTRAETHLERQKDGSQREAPPPASPQQPRPRHFRRRVRDVMTTAVVTVDTLAPYKEIVRLLTENGIRGVPVLSAQGQVTGVVTEADLLADEEKTALERTAVSGQGQRPRWHGALTAGELMTSPAATIGPDATVSGAVWAMSTHRVRMLPVVDGNGCLLGIVSRRDLLSVFLRPDDDVAAEIREIFQEVLHAGPGLITVTVKDGVVVLTGPLGADRDQVAVTIRLAWSVDGVVDVIDRRGIEDGAKPAEAHRAASPAGSS